MATRSLLILDKAQSLYISLECFLVTDNANDIYVFTGVCPQGRGSLFRGSLSRWGSLSRGDGVSVQGWGSLSRGGGLCLGVGVSVQRVGVSVQMVSVKVSLSSGDLCQGDPP